MDLVHWNLLYLLPLAAIPIILHLLTLHRLKTVELSTFRFLFDSYVQQRRRMKFLEALLAILRTLFLLLLVVALSRPVVRHWSALFGGGSGRDVIFLVDCSASMNARTDGVSSLERAKSVAHSVLDRLADDDRVTLIRVASRAEEVFSRFNSDAEAIEGHLDGLHASPSRGNWFAAFSHLFGPAAPARSQPTVYVLSDCQASGWRELAMEGAGTMVPGDAKIVVVNVGSTKPGTNLAVVGNPPREHRGVVGLPLILQPRVANDSSNKSGAEPASTTLTVTIDEKEVARLNLSIKPGETESREVIYVPSEPGVLRGRFELDEDRFPDDDQYLFTLHVVPQIRVVLVNGNPNADPYQDEALYLRTALSSTSRPDTQKPEPSVQTPAPSTTPSTSGTPPPAPAAELKPDESFIHSLDVQEVAESLLNPEMLREASVVILANCGTLNAQQFGWLRDFVGSGGGLLIFPGDKVNPEVYNTQFFTLPGPQQERLLGAQLGPPVGDPLNFDQFVRLGSVDYAHPVLTVFEDRQARYLTTANFSRRFPIILDTAQANGWALLSFAPTEPALVEGRFHDGLVLLAAFPATTAWGNLPLKPEFVPLVLRLVHHLEHRPQFEVPSVVPADGDARIAVSADWTPALGRVTDVAQRTGEVKLNRDGSRLVGAFEGTALKGYYTVELQGGRVEQPKSGTASFAVNLAAEESKFVPATEDELRTWLPGSNLTVIDASAEAQQALGAIGDSREVWRIPLLATLFVICVEFVLATLGGKRVRRDEDGTEGDDVRTLNPVTWIGRMTGAEAT